MITELQLKQIAPKCKDTKELVVALNTLLPKYNITTPLRIAHFLWSPGGGGYSDGMANDGTVDNRPTTPTTSTGGSETRPRNVAMMYIIKI